MEDVIFSLIFLKTPDWEVPCGNSATCPRDSIIVFGNEIVEATMSIRGRFFEYRPYRSLIQEYWRGGAAWTSAPRPLLRDSLYAPLPPLHEGDQRWEAVLDGNLGLSEEEPVWDAADFLRLGMGFPITPKLILQWYSFGMDFRIYLRFRKRRNRSTLASH